MMSNNNTSLTLSRLPELAATKSIDAAQLIAVTEFLGRLEALLKRPDEIRETTLSVGSLHLDLLTRTVVRGRRSINLLPREFRLLEYMMRHHGQLVTRAMLFRDVWNLDGWSESKDGKTIRHEGILDRLGLSREDCEAIIMNARIKAGWIT
jgi:hypothetical protein